MPTLEEERIVAIADRLLRAAGAPDEHANIVARHMANANLAGHDSHGFIRVIQYLTEIDSGRIDPKGKPEVIRDSVATAQVNGNNGFGQVANQPLNQSIGRHLHPLRGVLQHISQC